MAKHLIALPSEFHFETSYAVQYSDINAANHLAADKILPITLETQLRFIKFLGYDDAVVFEDAGLMMVNSEINYLSEGWYGDELRIELGICNMQYDKKDLDFVYRITNIKNSREVVRACSTMLFFDAQRKKVIPIPDMFRRRVDECVP